MEPQTTTPLQNLEPPAPTTRELNNPFLLALQTIYFFLILIPVTVYSVIKNTFFNEPKCLKEKVVLVTGSGRGLGQGFALKFAELGCKVACVDVDEHTNEETVQMINDRYPKKAKGYKCNVGATEEIRALKRAVYEDFGRIDVLVHNAAMICGASVTDFEDVYLHGLITVNLTSHFFLIREFLPDMMKRNEGHIAAVASISGFEGIAEGSIYCATKHGIIGLMDALYYELQQTPGNNVQTSVICPWFINTSESYNKCYSTRIPELSISEVVNAAVDGIRRNKRIITVPSYMYFAIHLSKLFPDQVNKIMRSIFYVKFFSPPMEEQKNLPRYKMFVKAVKQIDFTSENS